LAPIFTEAEASGFRSAVRGNRLIFLRGGAHVDGSTLLRRTDAGHAELAAPANGLSITQRRLLTLLDTSATIGQLAATLPIDDERLAREAVRLAQLGLVEAVVGADVPAPLVAAAAPVRLGAPPAAHKARFGFAILAAGALAWIGWHYATPPAPTAHGQPAAQARNPVESPGSTADAAEPTAIATRVLRTETSERPRDTPKEGRTAASARTALAAPAATPGDARPHEPAAERFAAPVETPSPTSAAAATPPAVQARSETSEAAPAAGAAPGVATAPAAAPSTPLTAPAEPVPISLPIQLAAATPPAQVVRAPAPSTLVAVSREAPEFPREALARGVDRGRVKVRLTVDAQGHVSKVDVLDASPQRVFDRVVRETLARWQFEPGIGERTTTVDLAFTRD
jgi:periplasmic protein TonB